MFSHEVSDINLDINIAFRGGAAVQIGVFVIALPEAKSGKYSIEVKVHRKALIICAP